MNKQFDGVNKQFERVDKQLEKIDQQFDGVNKQFDGVHKQIEGLAIMTQKGFTELREEMHGEFSKVNKRLDKLEEEVLAIHLELEYIKRNAGWKFEVRGLDERLHKVEIKLGLAKEE
ncbi:MAG: hypothetical protein HYT12_02470 [Candidatus Liptonbacteria bacterium]|nr:hypothetical protein [Candidatus Liptonbacteria bacterium]